MPKPNPTLAAVQDFKAWFSYAQEDLISAQILLRENVFRAATYHTQQCVEKALKSYLVFKEQEIRKTHDLVELTQLCAELDFEFITLLEIAKNIKPYATRGRYPDDFLPPEKDDVKEIVEQAERILKFVQQKLNS